MTIPKLLVIAETNGAKILPATLPAIAFSQQWAELTSGTFDILLLGGSSIAASASEFASYGAAQVLIAASDVLTHPVADSSADAIVTAAKQVGAGYIAGPSTQFGRDVLPRVAALLDVPMLSDVLSISGGADGLTFKRPMYAGNVIATVKIGGEAGVFSVRTTAFGKPREMGGQSSVRNIEVAPNTSGAHWVSLDAPEQKRPELTGARVVVSGGRPLRDAETFECVLGGLADKLGGALGATRAAVDSGIAPNELQVGQTGKIVAPELYIAAGVSGSVQHLAGMKDSKVIVAINNDPDAPIFDVADYGLVADLHQAVPELTSKL